MESVLERKGEECALCKLQHSCEDSLTLSPPLHLPPPSPFLCPSSPSLLLLPGVTHLTVSSDVEGVMAILDWLAFVPHVRGGPLPFTIPLDPVDRLVEYTPTKVPYDPRWMLAGRKNTGGCGLFIVAGGCGLFIVAGDSRAKHTKNIWSGSS